MLSSLVHTFSDPDQYTAAMQATSAEVTITGRGHFNAKLIRIQLRDLWMQRYSETLPRIAHAANVPGRAIIMFRTEPGPGLLWDGMEIQPGSIVRFSEAQSGLQRAVGAARFGSMSLPVENLVSAGAVMKGVNLAPPHNPMVVTPSPSAMARLQRLHAAAATLAEDAPDIFDTSEAARGVEQSLIAAMVACLGDRKTRGETGARHHHAAIMRRFHRLLDECSDNARYIPEICAAIGVSDRLLRVCCQEQLGMGPYRYLLLRRLHLARRALQTGQPSETNVTEVATRYGFFELGRFAGAYKEIFAELPSATLAREPRVERVADLRTELAQRFCPAEKA